MVTLKIALGLLLLIAAWAYLFQKKFIFKLNAWMREIVFSDQLALFSGRRVAVLLLVLGGLALFSGLESIIKPAVIPPNIVAQILEQAHKDMVDKRYERAVRRCREIVKVDPAFVPAWELLMEVYSRMGEKDKARNIATVLLRLNPNHPTAKIVAKDDRYKNPKGKK